jgi:hypothetical protein
MAESRKTWNMPNRTVSFGVVVGVYLAFIHVLPATSAEVPVFA